MKKLVRVTDLDYKEEDGKVVVENYCIAVSGDTIDTDGFVQFLREKFLYLVFPEEEVEERGPLAYHDAQQRVGYTEDYLRAGLYSELLLFVLVDAILNMPMICHKMALKQDPSDEQKGSDGVFFGEYNGEECLGIGEAKFYTDLKGGLRSSLSSTSNFHGPDGDVERRHELNVATRSLSKNLSKSKIQELADRLTSASRDYQLMHPVFVGYEAKELREAQTRAMDEEELLQKIKAFVDEEEDLVPYIKDKLSDDYPELEKFVLVFILLPVEDTKGFKTKMRNAIYPHLAD